MEPTLRWKQLGRLIKQARYDLELSPREVVVGLGYRNLNKGHRRLRDLEAGDRVGPKLLTKVIHLLDIDGTAAATAANRDHAEWVAAWDEWSRRPIPLQLKVKWFAGFWHGVALPAHVADDPKLAEAHARKVAQENARPVVLVLSRRRCVEIDQQGTVTARRDLSPGQSAQKGLRIRGKHLPGEMLALADWRPQ